MENELKSQRSQSLGQESSLRVVSKLPFPVLLTFRLHTHVTSPPYISPSLKNTRPRHEGETRPSFMRLYTNQSRKWKVTFKNSVFLFTFQITENMPKLSLIFLSGGGAHGRYSLLYLKLTMLTLLLLRYLPFCPSTDLFKATIREQHIVLDMCTVTGSCRVSVSGPQYF